MRTIFICFEVDKKTGLNEISKVSTHIEFAREFLSNNSSCHRVEEWLVDDGSGSNEINTFYTMDDLENRMLPKEI